MELGIGPLQRAQAIEVCRCIYDAYRYTYVNEHLYYPDRVVALNESGDTARGNPDLCRAFAQATLQGRTGAGRGTGRGGSPPRPVG